MRYAFFTTVTDIYHYTPTERVDHDGTEHKSDGGWFVRLDGSYVAIHVGDQKPLMQVGDTVKLTIEACPAEQDKAAS